MNTNDPNQLDKQQRMSLYLWGWLKEELEVGEAATQELVIVSKGMLARAKEPSRVFLALGRHKGRAGDITIFQSTVARVHGAIRGSEEHMKLGQCIYNGVHCPPSQAHIYDLSQFSTLTQLDRMDIEGAKVRHKDVQESILACTDGPVVHIEEGTI